MTNAERRLPETAERNVSVPIREEGVLSLPDPFVLEGGGSLANAALAWECVGSSGAPLVVVLGGISAHRRCAESEGWWSAQCGVGRAVDPERFRLLSVDWLGGCDASTGPQANERFPAVATTDQARAILLLLNRLGF